MSDLSLVSEAGAAQRVHGHQCPVTLPFVRLVRPGLLWRAAQHDIDETIE